MSGAIHPRGRAFPWAFAACALTVVVGVAHAIVYRWVCDDPFITFRYIDQFLAGNGLVFNSGERVEGFTHPLWLALLLVARALGAELVVASQVLGLVFHGGTLALLAAMSWKVSRGGRFLFPLAAVVFALHRDAAIWATGGLETSLFTFLVTLSVYVTAATTISQGRRAAIAGTVLALAVLTRPDAILFAAAAAIFLGWKYGVRALAAFAASFLAILGPVLVWKLATYGTILPNPYYAKSGGGSYFEQGLRYIALFVKAYPSTLLLPAALLAWVVQTRRSGRATLPPESPVAEVRGGPILLLATSFVAIYTVFFVARVGGDFMFARFLIPLVPLVYLGLEILLRGLARGRLLTAALVVLPILVVAEGGTRDRLFRDPQGGPGDRTTVVGIGDEHWYYTHQTTGRNVIETYALVGSRLARIFEGTSVRVLIGGQASLGYYGRFAYCLEECGLTDPEIARLPVTAHGRPGHEKVAPFELLIRRGIHFEFMKRPHREDAYRVATFDVGEGRVRAEILTYDADLMDDLARRFPGEVDFVDFPAYLDAYLTELDAGRSSRSPEELRTDYEAFRDFYFRHNEDQEREARFLAILRARGIVPGEASPAPR